MPCAPGVVAGEQGARSPPDRALVDYPITTTMMRVHTVAQTMKEPTRRQTVMQMRIRLMAIRRSEMVTSARDGPQPFACQERLRVPLGAPQQRPVLAGSLQRVDHRLLIGERRQLVERPLGTGRLKLRHGDSPVTAAAWAASRAEARPPG
jgi:hypothetical protein